MKVVLGVAAFALAVVAPQAPAGDSWMTDENGVLQMMLAHEEKSGPDGGLLTVDRNKKTISWAGAPGEHGCKLKVEGAFDSVKSVKDNGREAGFLLEMKEGKTRKLVLLPLPYAEWFVRQWEVAEGSFGKTLPEGTLRTGGGRGDDSTMTPSGSASNAGPSVKHQDVPEEVELETRKAVTVVRDALGGTLK